MVHHPDHRHEDPDGKRIQPHVAYADDFWAPYTEGKLEAAWADERADGLGLLLRPAGLFVLDVDDPGAEEYVRAKGMPRTPGIGSVRGPKFVLRRGSLDIPKNAGGIAPHIDLENLMTPVPPTASYRWLPGAGPDDVPVALAPAWLVRAIRKLNATRRAPVKISAAPVPNGQRHVTLARVVGKGARTWEPADLLLVARALNAHQFVPPLPDAEVVRIVEDIVARERGKRAPESEDLRELRDKLEGRP